MTKPARITYCAKRRRVFATRDDVLQAPGRGQTMRPRNRKPPL